MLDGNQLRMQILPMLETAGLIIQESSGNDKRKRLIFPASYKKKMGEKGGLSGQAKKETQTT